MKYLFRDDVGVQVWREEREVPLQYAKFYKGIFDVTLRGIAYITFVPAFQRPKDNWPPALPDDVDIVHSCNQARLFTAALADVTVTADEALAGSREFIPLPPSARIEPYMGVVFYVTPQEFARFSEELLYIEKNHTLWANQYVRLSKVKDFESIKFILANIVPLKLARHAKSLPKSISGFPNKPTLITNRAMVPELVPA